MSDLLFLILVNSFRIASLAQERWLYGETMCDLNPFFARYFYLNTTLHLIAVSFDRYEAIVKSPLTYDGTITKSSMAFIALIWLLPIPICIGPFLGRGKYVYNPEIFYCEQGWTTKGEFNGWETTMVIAFLAVPLLVIIVLNWSVYKTAKVQINALAMQMGNRAASEGQQEEDQEKQRRLSHHYNHRVLAELSSHLDRGFLSSAHQKHRSFSPCNTCHVFHRCRQLAVQPDHLFHPQKRIPNSDEESVQADKEMPLPDFRNH